MKAVEQSLSLIEWAAQVLIQYTTEKVIAVEPLPNGGNNRAYVVITQNNRYFLKHYFQSRQDARNRLRSEYAFASFAWRNGIQCVPQPLVMDDEAGVGIYTFLMGKKLTQDQITQDCIQQTIRFFELLNQGPLRMQAQSLSPAAEACFSIREHLQRVDSRIEQLSSLTVKDDIDEEAAGFFHEKMLAYWRKIKQRVLNTRDHIDHSLPREDWVLSPSDFGFHNAIWMDNHEIKFIDFEYAGWDDPAKLICDFFSQPAVPVPLYYFTDFANAVAKHTTSPAATLNRVQLLLPILQFKWCCIALNGFLPSHQARKNFAKPITSLYRQHQIQLAKKILAGIYV